MSTTSKFSFVITDRSIVVTLDNGDVSMVQHTAPNYKALFQAIQDYMAVSSEKNYQKILNNLTVVKSIQNWAKGCFKIQGDKVLYKGEPLPEVLAQRMFRLAAEGVSPKFLMNFWEKLQQNPSHRSVEQLFPFLQHQGIPITGNGNFLAYKGVTTNYTDLHTESINNRPGNIVEMPRNKISDDPNEACHYGLHVGALEYAQGFGPVVVICEVNPADVVCIPYDSSQRKMRVCRYRVVGNHNGELLPSTSYNLEDEPEEEKSSVEASDTEFVDPLIVTDNELNLALTVSDTAAVSAYQQRTGVTADDAKQAITHAVKSNSRKAMDKPLEAVGHEPKEKKMKSGSGSKEVKLKVPDAYKKIHKMGFQELFSVDISTLRKYAANVLHIVGASKIPGGKASLIPQIMKVRENFK